MLVCTANRAVLRTFRSQLALKQRDSVVKHSRSLLPNDTALSGCAMPSDLTIAIRDIPPWLEIKVTSAGRFSLLDLWAFVFFG